MEKNYPITTSEREKKKSKGWIRGDMILARDWTVETGGGACLCASIHWFSWWIPQIWIHSFHHSLPLGSFHHDSVLTNHNNYR